MFDIGMWELMVVGIVALIVVGPKDLPKMFRTLGQVSGRIRGMAREFQTTMNAAASDTGLDDLAKDLKKATDVTRDLRKVTNPRKMGMDAVKRAAGSALDDDETAEPERPLSETEKLAQKRHKDAEARVAAAQERAAARASAAVEAAEDAAAIAADDLPPAEPRTGTADT